MARRAEGHPRRFTLGLSMVLAGFLIISSSPAFAQSRNTKNTLKLDNPASRPGADVSSLGWLAGYWHGQGALGTSEEVWMPPSHGTMAGAFKVVRENQPHFYEFIEISEEEGSLTLKIKHFDPNLTGWEEKDSFVSFPLVKLGHNEAYFSGLTYRRTGDTELRAYVAIEHDDGQTEEIELIFQSK